MKPVSYLKKRVFRIEYLFLIYFLLQISCRNSIDRINNQLIKDFFIDSIFVKVNTTSNQFKTKISTDTLKCNQNLNYTQALSSLKNLFEKIETTNESEVTKIYLKALYLSEFVYASFSFQFMGFQHGKTNHHIAIENWNNMSLENCYNMANNNLVPVWCGDRTSFYVRLLDSLLGIKATTISIKNVHTFPLVNIGNRRFIFDPYDPFVVFDSLKLRVVDYDEAQENSLNNYSITIQRTKRLYGEANELVSNDLANDILAVSKNEKQNFSQKLKEYLIMNQSFFLKNIEKCSFERYNKKGIIYNSNLKDDRYIIQLENNLKNLPMNLNHFKKYYFGIECK
jgi:hypothetical protein